jgi:LPS-assembly protein
MPTEDWHAAFDSKRSSDAEYLRKYRLGQEDYLVTHAYAETANQNNYTIVRGLTFQGLRSTDRASTTPVILPQADMYLESERAEDDSYWSLRNNLMMLSRQQGTDSNRISSTAEWTKPYVSDSGHMFEWRNSLRGDGYFVDDVTDDLRVSQRGSLDGTVGRMIPQAELGWRYPLIRQRGEILPQIVLEPMLNVIASPYGGNPRKIPNEDSRSVEYSDDNLFNANHFTGFDRVESGPRSNYGVRGTLNTENQGSVNFLVGQNLRTKEDENFPRSSGLQDRTSDYVARLGYRTPQAFDVSYRTRIDKDNGEMHRHDVTGSMALDPLQISTNYLYLDQEFAEIVTQDPNREELSGWATLALTEEWSLTSSLRRDMAEGKYRGGSYGVMYNGPCVMMLLSLNRDFTRTQEVAPTADVTFQILFKSLNWNSQAPPRMNINSQGGLCTTEYCY